MVYQRAKGGKRCKSACAAMIGVHGVDRLLFQG
jgi:hypothetical protein